MTTQAITSVSQYLNIVLKDDDLSDKVVCYRGHSNTDFKLVAKVFRYNSAKKNEERILSELLTESPDDFRDDRSVFEQLVRAQHYDLPTRLLDVTLNPLVALFFAAREGGEFDRPGEVIQFRISNDRAKLFDSDTVSCIANIARLSYEEKNAIFKRFNEKKGKGGASSIDIDPFNEWREIVRLVQFIRVEKPYFQNRISPIDLRKFYFVRPKLNNKRILAQSGAFILAGLLKSISEESSTALELERIRVAPDGKSRILSELDKLHINERTMFPEIENASTYIGKKFMKNG